MQTLEQVLDNLTGEAFIEWLSDYITATVKGWPELQVIAQAHPKMERVRKFLMQRYLAAAAFFGRDDDPGFLAFACANLSESDDPLAEYALTILEHKRGDELAATKHQALWSKLLQALGSKDEQLKQREPRESTRDYIAELSDVYSNSDWPTVLGAFTAHEKALGEEYAVLSAMLQRIASIGPEALAVFHPVQLPQSQSGTAGHVLDKIVFDRETKQLVWNGVARQLQASRNLYQGLLKYLEDKT